jgi:hypothetical protein
MKIKKEPFGAPFLLSFFILLRHIILFAEADIHQFHP